MSNHLNIYDHQGRLIETRLRLNNDPEIILAQNTFDGVGTLASRQRFLPAGSSATNTAFTTNYSHHIRGGLRTISSDFFSQTLLFGSERVAYSPTNAPRPVPTFNGNISAIVSRNFLTPCNPYEIEIAQYNFQYDALNRLIDAGYFSQIRSLSSSDIVRQDSDFSIRNIVYDLHGNIRILQRLGITQKTPDNQYQTGLVDALFFHYYGNMLVAVADWIWHTVPYYGDQTHPPFEVEVLMGGILPPMLVLCRSMKQVSPAPVPVPLPPNHDANGNLIIFPSVGTCMYFDPVLNKPISVSNFSSETRFVYDASGNMVSRARYSYNPRVGTTTETIARVGPITQTRRIIIPRSPAEITTATYSTRIELGEGVFWQNGNYFVRFTDYQGSVRVVVRACIEGRPFTIGSNIVEVNNFDPWGVEFGRAQNPFGMQDIKHQDMERLNFGQMNVHNHGARWAFNAVGRWLGMDPLMELFYSVSPFVYNMNNPVRFIDPDGRKALDMMTDLDGWFEDMNNNIVWTHHTSQKEMDRAGIEGRFLGEAVVHFKGSHNERLGADGRLTGEGANPARVTIHGIGGPDDIQTHLGMTTPTVSGSSTLNAGEFRAFFQDMATSVYGTAGAISRGIEPALTYRITSLDGTPLRGTRNGRDVTMDGVFLHRTNWGGGARSASRGCPIIDGRSWRRVEEQLGTSANIFLRITR